MNIQAQSLTERIAEIKGAKVLKSFCYTCPWTCPTEVYVRDGKVVYHKGNPDAPNNIGTRCAKGMASAWVTRDPDRLKYPMLRTNPKGQKGEFKRISWDEAFKFIADKLRQIEKEHGPEAVCYLSHHDPNSIFMVQLLAQLYGTPNISLGHAMGCEGDRRSACLTTFGSLFPMHDFTGSKYVILWGMNMLGANQGLFESRALLQAKKNGCKLVVVDPSFTETAQKADEWIPIKPGTDAAMGLAMCKHIIDEGLYDQDYVNTYCHGFDGFRDHLAEKGYTPEWAEEICGIDAGTIRRLAREFATTKPSISAQFKGSGYYTNGNDGGRVCYILAAICGQIDKPGTFHLDDWAPIGHPVAIPEEAMRKPEKAPLAHAMGYALAPLTGYPVVPEIPSSRLPGAVIEDDPYPIRGIFCQATNPVMSDPNRDRVQAMFAKLDLAVAQELYMSETALECDIVLPETSFYEQAELRQGMWLGPEAILCQPVVEPVGEAKPAYEIAKGLAQEMGWGEYFSYETWEDWAAVSAKDLPVSVDDLKEKGFWAGNVSYGRVEAGLGTPSGKIEIYSNAYEGAGHNPYPEWRERSVIPDDEFPLQVTHSKLSMHCNIVTQNNPFLMEICPENWVEINSVDATKYGIADGGKCVIESPKDNITMTAKVVEGLVPGCISIRHGHGFGHWAMGSVAKGKGAHSNNLMDTHTNPITGTNNYNECKVRIRAA
ncbi:MAG: molybdopterin-dependent oxidoreductase [Paracoccaceae bacterium]|nr:molybdopterin-dependent oxidoreductase [Paracoccaceae bacterium]